VKERHNVPRAWTKVGKASRSEHIHLAIGLKQRNEGVVEQHLLEVSDPNHHRYGQHLTASEIEDIVRPSSDTQNLVKAWLSEHGITGVENPSKDFIHVLLPIEKAEELLQTEYSIYKHHDGETVSRAPEWSLPLHLHDHIDIIQPTTSFFRPKPRAKGIFEPDAESYSLSWWENEGKRLYGSPDGGRHGGPAAGGAQLVCEDGFHAQELHLMLCADWSWRGPNLQHL
jgi:tripeptidyl-peptidase-1